MNPKEFEKILEKIPGVVVDKTARQFAIYYNELIKTNQKYNLTRITDLNEAYLKHFYDSIIPIFYFNSDLFTRAHSLCDVGTGGGFPGIPLKIIYPELKLTLLDSSQKKLQFLKNLCELLQLNNVDFVWQRAEDFGRKKGREKFDLVVSRAVANLRILSEYCLPLVKKSGNFIAYKGKNGENEILAANHLISMLGGKIQKTVDVDLKKDDDYRTLILIHKIKITPHKYPRANGQIKAKMKGSHGK